MTPYFWRFHMALIMFDMFLNHHQAEERLVVHYQYVSWPDRGVPEDSASILEMMTLIYKSKTFSLDSQQVVHCRYSLL